MVRVELKGYKEALGIFDSKPVKRAAVSALKKVAKAAVSSVSSEIRTVYNVKKSDLDPRLKIRPARADSLAAEIEISGKGMSLSFFGAKQTAQNRTVTRAGKNMKVKTTKRSAAFQGVTVEVEKGKKTQLRSAFMTRMKSGHIGVMRRQGKDRLPIYEKKVISLASMLENAKVAPAVLEKVNERWGVIFPQELKYFLSKQG